MPLDVVIDVDELIHEQTLTCWRASGATRHYVVLLLARARLTRCYDGAHYQHARVISARALRYVKSASLFTHARCLRYALDYAATTPCPRRCCHMSCRSPPSPCARQWLLRYAYAGMPDAAVILFRAAPLRFTDYVAAAHLMLQQ